MFVLQVQHGSCFSVRLLPIKLNLWKSLSPSCISMSSKCTLRRSMRTGVPVFILAWRMPWHVILSVRCGTAGSDILPPGTWRRPMCISPLRKVPAVMTMLRARSSAPQMVLMPLASPCSTISSSAWSCQMSRLGVLSSTRRHSQMNFSRSHCALGLHTAGPFERLSMRNCIAVASVTSAMLPPRASISRTICPFAIPPIAGLQLIWAILFMSMVTRQVLAPMFANAFPPPCHAPVCQCQGRLGHSAAKVRIKIEFLTKYFDLSPKWSIFAHRRRCHNTYNKVL